MPPYQYSFPSRQLVNQNDAAMIENANVPRSRFTTAWSRKMTFDAAMLTPIFCKEVLPGDHWDINATAYVRIATPLFPIFDSLRIDTHFFFTPNRIVWSNFTKMMGEQINPADSINFTTPIIDLTTSVTAGSIYDHLALPIGNIAGGQTLPINALPLRMYNRIYNDWFRDQNLQDSLPINTGNGPDAVGDSAIQRRNKSHDYFTSCLPWPNKFTAPSIPLSGNAPVQGLGIINAVVPAAGTNVYDTDGVQRAYPGTISTTDAAKAFVIRTTGTSAIPTSLPNVFADLTLATGVTINQLRQSFMIQALLERDARGGTRYVELIRSHFGVTNPDFRLQRPEYIGGGQTMLHLTPIAQTAPGTSGTLGALGAAGTAAGQHRASYAATEHGFIIGLISSRTELSYQQGLHKQWSRSTRYDYYWPALAALGEQAVLRKEIYATGTDVDDDTVFGYQERWHEYRTHYNEITGLFRSTAAGNIDEWHLGQQFGSPPTLNDAFIKDTPPMARILAAGAAEDGKQLLADIHFQVSIVRPIPLYGTPALLGRF